MHSKYLASAGTPVKYYYHAVTMGSNCFDTTWALHHNHRHKLCCLAPFDTKSANVDCENITQSGNVRTSGTVHLQLSFVSEALIGSTPTKSK